MASVPEVEATLHGLIRRLEEVDPAYRGILPGRRTIQADCPDLGLTYHAFWRQGKVSELYEGPPESRADIRISIDSDDLVSLVGKELAFGRAYSEGRIRIDASMTDLLRLRAVM